MKSHEDKVLMAPCTTIYQNSTQSSFKLQQFLCSRGYAMDNLDEVQRIHPSESESDTEDTEPSPPPVIFDTFAPDHIPVTPATPVLPTRDPRPSPEHSPGVIPLGTSPATQLLTALDLQLLHTPCDRSLPEGFSTPTGSDTSVAPLRFDSDDETISMGSDSDSSASTDVSVPRRKRRKNLFPSD